MKVTKEDVTRARDSLSRLKAGDTVYTVLRHVSRSGMQRQLSVIVFQDGHVFHPNWSVAVLTGARLNRAGARDAIVMNGCGYNQGHEIVSNLSMALGLGLNALRHEEL